MGRYAYRMQPTMLDFALKKLGIALAPLLGAEAEKGELQAGWADSATPEQKKAWKQKGSEQVEPIIGEFKDAFKQEYLRLSGLVCRSLDSILKLMPLKAFRYQRRDR